MLILALVNQICHHFGWVPLPATSEELYTRVSWVFTAVAAIIVWWKNNSFTGAAIKADELLKGIVSGVSAVTGAEISALSGATGSDSVTGMAGELLSELMSKLTDEPVGDTAADHAPDTEAEPMSYPEAEPTANSEGDSTNDSTDNPADEDADETDIKNI